ncbi:hypothetical protein MYCTH_2297331 [Thermothelomyces thermophilus ATCC 42464]|uniref:BPL/LPL catalytic domain-containing protein n=1 Tax=Thermothelomyces thermophilus (strain ATCC 42464 / BCRC 31852 / DSM 1799) TaxID=573729 RepID=G2Q5H1_THET4|nr:uncharacterized protein MYCTH_2297331 [Thermothelomyces thermophilus ATCC 42464]AEO54604.1 hypothetical protein MYCTH_2297331 [Thermothelomyces thermophilus ATCC 42464]
MAPLRLRHLHLPSIHPDYVPYSLASRVQEHLRRQHLDFKDGSSTGQPPPTLISFTPSPIFTLGRRQTAPLTPSEAARLTAPLHIPSPFPSPDDGGASFRPRLVHSPRGGLTTYHGPGQIVLWPVLDLRSPRHRNYTVRCYARLLESTTIATLRALFGIRAFTTDDPGVWVVLPSSPAGQPPGAPDQDGPAAAAATCSAAASATDTGALAKIAALGVHLRRHVTALGTAINVAMPEQRPGPVVPDNNNNKKKDEEAANPWARFVACGLQGRGVTSIAGQQQQQQQSPAPAASSGGTERMVADAWAEELAERLGLGLGSGSGSGDEGGLVEVVGEEEVLRLMEELVSSSSSLSGERGGESAEEGEEEEEEEVLEEERAYLRRMRHALGGR